MKITGIILAGGKSSRMGDDKGLMLLNGKPMVQYVIQALQKVVSTIIIISNNEEYEKFGFKVYNDLIKEKGPVGGIYTGLHYSDTEINICVSCDTPLINSSFLSWLLLNSKNNLVTISSYKGKTNQLIGVYKKSGIEIFKKRLDHDLLKLKDAILELNSEVLEVSEMNSSLVFDESIFLNANTKYDLELIENKLVEVN